MVDNTSQNLSFSSSKAASESLKLLSAQLLAGKTLVLRFNSNEDVVVAQRSIGNAKWGIPELTKDSSRRVRTKRQGATALAVALTKDKVSKAAIDEGGLPQGAKEALAKLDYE